MYKSLFKMAPQHSFYYLAY